MKNLFVQCGTAILALLIVTGCQSPENRVEAGVVAEKPLPNDQQVAEEEIRPLSATLRISREFFEYPVYAYIQVDQKSQDRSVQQYESLVRWEVGEPEGPEPAPGYIADYRDRPGCAQMTSQAEMWVCFTVVPDLMTMAVEKDQVSLKGLDSEILGPCNEEPKSIALIRAEKGAENSLSLLFSVDYDSQCDSQEISIQLESEAPISI